MTRRLKVFLPKWMRWFILALFAPIWGLMLYVTFLSPDRAGRLPPVGFVLVSITLLVVAVFVWLSSAGRLPTHVIEIEEDDVPKPPR